MSSINTISVSGNLTADPELRRTATQVPFARMRVAVSQRFLNAETKAWEDRQDGFFTVTAWRDLATHAGMSLRKGDRVTVSGKLIRRAYEAEVGEGQTETRHVHEIEAEDLGPSLRWQAWARLEPRAVAAVEPSTATSSDPEEATDATAADADVTRAA